MKNAPYRPSPNPEVKKRRTYSREESTLQQVCFRWFSYSYPIYKGLFFKIHNEGKKNKISAAIDKGQGIVAGIPDMFLSVPACGYHGLYIEFKKADGKLSEKQKTIHALLKEQGYRVEVIRTIDEFIHLITEYL